MLVSSRGAAELLAARVSSFEQARRLLRSGAAGPPTLVGGTVAYAQERVHELAERPWVDENVLATACPWGVHVARLARGRLLDLARPWEELAAHVAVQPALPPMTAMTLGARMQVAGAVAWVATVSGFVVLGADATGWRTVDDGQVAFTLDPPGAWFEHVDRRWFARGRGRHWFFWDPWRLQQ